MIDPRISKHMSNLAKKRKKPHFPFKDPELARKAQKASVRARKLKQEHEKALEELEDL